MLILLQKGKYTMEKSKMKKKWIIVIVIVVLAAGIIGIELYNRVKISRGNALLLEGRYNEAFQTYPSSKSCEHERIVAELLDQEKDIEAVSYSSANISNEAIIEYIKENCYNKMMEAIGNNDYIAAQEYMIEISDYKDTGSRKQDIEQNASYQQAINELKTSLHKGVLQLKKLPEDFKDVSELLDKLLPYDQFIGKKYGNYWGYITDYLEIEDFEYDLENDCVTFPNWGDATVLKSSLEGYDYEAEWGKYDRIVYWNSDEALVVTADGQVNVLSPDGSVDHSGKIPKSKSNSQRTCPNCNGARMVRTYSTNSPWEEPTYIECPMCHGTGIVSD